MFYETMTNVILVDFPNCSIIIFITKNDNKQWYLYLEANTEIKDETQS